MIIRNIPLRHELKYFITPAELNVLRSSLKPVMQLDPNGNENNEYHIRSLYFDTIIVVDRVEIQRARCV